jgi:hypothetical protein
LADQDNEPAVSQSPQASVQRKTGMVPPGVAVVMLGMAAAAYTLIPSEWPNTPAARALWISAFCVLGVAEILAIFRERSNQNKDFALERDLNQSRFERTMERFEQIRRASESHNQSLLRLMQTINDPAQSLKKKALELSESILDFVYLRIQGQPQEGPPMPLAAFARPKGLGQSFIPTPTFSMYMKYDRDTLLHYGERFSVKVAAILEELAKHGFVDDVLDKRSKDLRYASDIMTIGERLGKLAERIESVNKS